MELHIDNNRISSNSWNIGHGNKILHLFYLLNLSERLGVTPKISIDSSLDGIFDLSKLKIVSLEEEYGKCLFKETSAFLPLNFPQRVMHKLGLDFPTKDDLSQVIERSKQQYQEEKCFLERPPLFDRGHISGHFWHYAIMPPRSVVEKYINVRQKLTYRCKQKYPQIESEKVVAVHLRDTDFSKHMSHIFKNKIALPDEYYTKAIELCESHLGKDIQYHLFSDNADRISKIFQGKNFVLHEDNAPLDWSCLYLAKNIIQSNSSFCWTASLYKQYSIQPKGGYNWEYPHQGSIPHGFEMPFSHIINIRN